MQPLLIILLLLSVLTNVLLILLLLRSGQQNTAEDHTDEISRIVRDEVEAETEVLADQLRVMQGEVTRTTSASARDMGTLLAESQRQSQEAATARLDAIDRAGAARQRAAARIGRGAVGGSAAASARRSTPPWRGRRRARRRGPAPAVRAAPPCRA